jgi:hypothetical protein
MLSNPTGGMGAAQLAAAPSSGHGGVLGDVERLAAALTGGLAGGHGHPHALGTELPAPGMEHHAGGGGRTGEGRGGRPACRDRAGPAILCPRPG